MMQFMEDYLDGKAVLAHGTISRAWTIYNPQLATNFVTQRDILLRRLREDPNLFNKNDWQRLDRNPLRHDLIISLSQIQLSMFYVMDLGSLPSMSSPRRSIHCRGIRVVPRHQLYRSSMGQQPQSHGRLSAMDSVPSHPWTRVGMARECTSARAALTRSPTMSPRPCPLLSLRSFLRVHSTLSSLFWHLAEFVYS